MEGRAATEKKRSEFDRDLWTPICNTVSPSNRLNTKTYHFQCPQQNNGHDCGVFALGNMIAIASGHSDYVKQKQITSLRAHLSAALLRDNLMLPMESSTERTLENGSRAIQESSTQEETRQMAQNSVQNRITINDDAGDRFIKSSLKTKENGRMLDNATRVQFVDEAERVEWINFSVSTNSSDPLLSDSRSRSQNRLKVSRGTYRPPATRKCVYVCRLSKCNLIDFPVRNEFGRYTSLVENLSTMFLANPLWMTTRISNITCTNINICILNVHLVIYQMAVNLIFLNVWPLV